MFFGIPMWWALLFGVPCTLSGQDLHIGILPLVLVILVRVLSAIVINRKLVHDSHIWHYLWVIPLTDLLTLPLMIQSARSDQVFWGGRWIKVRPDLTAEYVGRDRIPT